MGRGSQIKDRLVQKGWGRWEPDYRSPRANRGGGGGSQITDTRVGSEITDSLEVRARLEITWKLVQTVFESIHLPWGAGGGKTRGEERTRLATDFPG